MFILGHLKFGFPPLIWNAKINAPSTIQIIIPQAPEICIGKKNNSGET